MTRVSHPGYEDDLAAQVDRMLAVASCVCPSFEHDCLSNPGSLVDHLSGLVSISTEAFPAELRPDSSEVACELGSDETLSGLFSQKEGSKPMIQVPYQDGDHRARWNFTLLHELGHYLQRNDMELVCRLAGIDDIGIERRFEETACNRFASHALLPDDYMKQFAQSHASAQHVATLYNKDRLCNVDAPRPRVSRQTMIRRFADFLPVGGTVTLVDTKQQLSIRAHGDGHVDYPASAESGTLTQPESGILEELKELISQPRPASKNRGHPSCIEHDGDAELISAAASYSGWGRWYGIIVIDPH